MNINDIGPRVDPDHLWFFIVRPGETDILFGAVAIALVLIVLGFGALYFTIQAWPDRLAAGVGKAQLQVVGILGLLSLLTMNNMLWVIALVLAAIRIPDIVTPLRNISRALSSRPDAIETPAPDVSATLNNGSDTGATPVKGSSNPVSDAGSRED
jgi:hypothetical protein